MKQNTFIVIIVFILAISSCFALTKEELSGLFYSADTPASLEKVTQIGLNNLPILEELLLTPSGDYIARFRAFALLRRASQNGQITKEKFFDIAFYQLKNIKTLASRQFLNEELTAFSQMLIYYSYSPTNNVGVSVAENFSNLFFILNSMLNKGLIDNHGIKNSLEAKFKNAEKNYEKKNKNSVINLLNAAKNEINAQTGKHIDEQGSTILINYTSNLINQVEKQ